MIYVCDAIMGTGKSSAAIEYMNEHKTDKFIYITPYLDEAERIKNGCPELHFVEPSNAFAEYNHRKSQHTAALIKRGLNITTTHQAFKNYNKQMLSDIRKHGYTLFIDESLDILKPCECNADDIRLVIDAGYIRKDENGNFVRTESEYTGSALAEIFWMLESRCLIYSDSDDGIFYWSLPKELLESFSDVYILTYMFEGQNMYYYLKMYHMEFESIHIQKKDNIFSFCKDNAFCPAYIKNIKSMIHILDHPKLNHIGFNEKSQQDDEYALSMAWFSKNKSSISQLQKNLANLYKNIWSDSSPDTRMWGTFSSAYGKLRGKGYTKGYVVFNARATNAHRHRRYLSYLANVYMNVNEKLFYQNLGLEVHEDTYALSVLVQWIWRSAIRDGEEIWLYLPSIRMRRLLTEWMDRLENGQTQ